MRLNKLLLYRLFISVILIISSAFLLSGSEYLVWRVKLLFGFHVGTVLSWFILTSASLLAISINRGNPRLGFLSSLSFYISIFWLLFSFLLAGNNDLEFHASPIVFNIWMVISAIPVFVLGISIIYKLFILYMFFKRKSW